MKTAFAWCIVSFCLILPINSQTEDVVSTPHSAATGTSPEKSQEDAVSPPQPKPATPKDKLSNLARAIFGVDRVETAQAVIEGLKAQAVEQGVDVDQIKTEAAEGLGQLFDQMAEDENLAELMVQVDKAIAYLKQKAQDMGLNDTEASEIISKFMVALGQIAQTTSLNKETIAGAVDKISETIVALSSGPLRGPPPGGSKPPAEREQDTAQGGATGDEGQGIESLMSEEPYTDIANDLAAEGIPEHLPEIPDEWDVPLVDESLAEEAARQQQKLYSKLNTELEKKKIKIEYRQAKTRALQNPQVAALWKSSQSAKTDSEKREILSQYYTLLFKEIRRINPALANYVNQLEAGYLDQLRRLQQPPPPAPVPGPPAPVPGPPRIGPSPSPRPGPMPMPRPGPPGPPHP